MITIYNAKKEFKTTRRLLKYSTLIITHKYNIGEIENEITNCIDELIKRWKRLEVAPNTFHSLYRFCISYRHRIVYTLSRPNFYCDLEKMRDFRILTRNEFLQSYSYLTEQEYVNTGLIQHLVNTIQ